jgi:hypothetical protein
MDARLHHGGVNAGLHPTGTEGLQLLCGPSICAVPLPTPPQMSWPQPRGQTAPVRSSSASPARRQDAISSASCRQRRPVRAVGFGAYPKRSMKATRRPSTAGATVAT